MKVKDGKCSSCLKCKSEGCKGLTSEKFNYEYCFACGCYLEGRTPAAKRQDIILILSAILMMIVFSRSDTIEPSQTKIAQEKDQIFYLSCFIGN